MISKRATSKGGEHYTWTANNDFGLVVAVCGTCGQVGQPQEFPFDARAIADRHAKVGGFEHTSGGAGPVTTTTEASEALARLREVVKPGDTLIVTTKGHTRSGVQKVTVRSSRSGYADLTHDVARTLGARTVDWAYLGLRPDDTPHLALDRLSVALFGEPGQIKGEYL